MTRRHAARGFTLIEVIIALAIVAMAVGALLGTVTSSASSVIYLKDKTIAEWVALNHLAEVRIAQTMPDLGKRTGKSEMGGMRWQWEEEVTELPFKGLIRIDVRARPTGETVEDKGPVRQPSAQTPPESTSSGTETEKLNWTTTVTGVVATARSDRRTPVAEAYAGSPQGGPNNNPGGNPNNGNPGGGNPGGGNPGGGPPNGEPNPGTSPPPKGNPDR